ncbi:MAG TPA: hypothetical protein VGM34_03605 [Chlamydiales bacterium]|jgi:hypothetical protein
MILERYCKAEGFFDCAAPLVIPDISRFLSWKGRLLSLINFFEKLGIVPFALLFKLYKTLARGVALALSALWLALTLFSSISSRQLFVRRAASLAQDLADWVLWPVAVFVCLSRLLLATLVHPALYLGCY